MTYLLDVNVMVALFDPAHAHHVSAHNWYTATGQASWSTCPVTENGFVRVVSNPAYPTVYATPAEAGSRLQMLCQTPGHVFWNDNISVVDPSIIDLSQLAGHQQITDAYLVALAAKHGGKLATFDKSIPIGALVGCLSNPVELIPFN